MSTKTRAFADQSDSLSPLPLSQGKVDLTELWRPFTRLNAPRQRAVP